MAWTENLVVHDGESATAAEVAETWIGLTFDYAVARTAAGREEAGRWPATLKPGKVSFAGFLDEADPALVEELKAARRRGDDDFNDRWLSLLATLESSEREAIVNSPAKQLHWHLLPASHALLADRVVSLSLADTVKPRWHPLPDDSKGQRELMWLFSHEGLVPGRGAVTVLESDEYAVGREPLPEPAGAGWRSQIGTKARWIELPDPESGHGGVATVKTREELFDTLYETAFAGYLEPVLDVYTARLKEHRIAVKKEPFFASGIVAMASPATEGYNAASTARQRVGEKIDEAAALDGVPDALIAKWTAANTAAGQARQVVRQHVGAVLRYFNGKPDYANLVIPKTVEALGAPAAVARLFVPTSADLDTKTEALFKSGKGCCRKFAGDPSGICNNCVRITAPAKTAELDDVLAGRGQRLVAGQRRPQRPRSQGPRQ